MVEWKRRQFTILGSTGEGKMFKEKINGVASEAIGNGKAWAVFQQANFLASALNSPQTTQLDDLTVVVRIDGQYAVMLSETDALVCFVNNLAQASMLAYRLAWAENATVVVRDRWQVWAEGGHMYGQIIREVVGREVEKLHGDYFKVRREKFGY